MPLPSFIIAGERRCGTTSLYHTLSAHPQVFLLSQTDLNYFINDDITDSRKWRSGPSDSNGWEARHTPTDYEAMFASPTGCRAVGHKGADLLFWHPAHARMSTFVPSVKLIVTLRDPVQRCWSHYWNEVGKGREWLSFEEAIAAEEDRAAASDYARLHLSYVARGFYAKSLQTLFETYPRANVHVVTLERCKSHPRESMEELCTFLDIDPDLASHGTGAHRNANWTLVPRSWTGVPVIRSFERIYSRLSDAIIVRLTGDPESRRRARRIAQFPFRRAAKSLTMPDGLRERLSAIYRSHLAELERLLGRQLHEWQV